MDGVYERSEFGNLNIYVQIYDPNTGYVIDALNLSDEVPGIGGLKLDPKEMKTEDEKIINELTEKLVLKIILNKKKSENFSNIYDFIINHKISKFRNFPIRKTDQVEKEEASAVFELLQNQITISSTKIAKKTSEAPTIVSVIDHNEMKDYGRISINEIMYQLPGFAPSMDYDRRTVSSRGMFESWDNSHYIFLIDGVQFNDHLYGTAYTWEITPLNFLKSLEIIRGPGSALYGSNSISGVVSLNTFSGEDLKGKAVSRVRAGSLGTRIYDIMAGNSTEHASYVFAYSSFRTDGLNYKGYDGSGRTNILER